jgi:hypothetical protein
LGDIRLGFVLLQIASYFCIVKKSVVAILAFLYLTITSGVVVNWHYCMGDLSSIEIGARNGDHCEKCGMADKKGCCETEYKLFKVQDEHQLAKVSWESNALPAIAPVFTSLIPVSNNEIIRGQEYYHAPPDERSNFIYLHTGVFRI